ncbi:UPF0193 protein EVG1 homolog [Onthophagus taurus]|uniref:UPF0193 protein EVG1 homolog n=1 Tax=Onthophagus taurus TaxID=166361 RepID=UPI000C201869|nr:UPF0193 protein EVG1 homolog [Onthophagus taurus]
MEWPSKNVPHGGIFHTAKANYSPDTKNYLKLLMDESHMNNKLRNKVNYTLRNGQSLPKFVSDGPKYYSGKNPQPPVLIRLSNWGKRSREAIVGSGAYDVPPFVPDHSKEDREKDKERLQKIMAFGKPNEREIIIKKKKAPQPKKQLNKFDLIVQEIEDRQNWLKEIEELGEGHQYRDLINMQIQEKLRELDQLKSN